jgi:protein-tyrosine phosphatase
LFIDIHSHIIPGVDDGAPDNQTALRMLRIAAECGTGHIVATPHFIPGGYKNSNNDILARVRELQSMADQEAIEIKMHAGCEAFITPELPSLLRDGIVATLGKTSYLLVELPMFGIPPYAEEVLFQLQLNGITPILAHPERNDEIMQRLDRLSLFLERGILAQINSGSVTGIYGKAVQRTAMKIIKKGYGHFIASDSHTVNRRSPDLSRASEIIKDAFGKEVMEKLFCENGYKVLRDEKII